MDNLTDNLHFNLSYPDFSQSPSLHVIHQEDTSFQTLPTSYSAFSLIPSSQLHQPTLDLTKENVIRKHLLSQPAVPQTLTEEATTMTTVTTATASTATVTESSILSLPSSPSSRKTIPTRTRVTRPPNAFLLFNKEMRKRLKIDNPTWTVSDISKEIGDRWRTLSQDEKHQYVIQANKIKENQQALHPNAMYIRRSKAELTKAGHYEKVEKKRADSREQQFAQIMAIVGTPSSLSSASPSASSSSSPIRTAVTKTGSSTTIGKSAATSTIVNEDLFGNNGSSFLLSQDHPVQPKSKRSRRKQKRDKNPGAPKHPLSAYMWYLTDVRPETRQSYPGSTVGQISKLCADRWNTMTEAERIPWLNKATADKARYAREMRVYASQNHHPMGRGTRQKYRATSPLFLSVDQTHTVLVHSPSSISSPVSHQHDIHRHHQDHHQDHQRLSHHQNQEHQEHQEHHSHPRHSHPHHPHHHSHHGLFYSSQSASNGLASACSSPVSASVDNRHLHYESSSLLRNSLPGNIPMQDTMNPSELLQTPLSSTLHDTDSY